MIPYSSLSDTGRGLMTKQAVSPGDILHFQTPKRGLMTKQAVSPGDIIISLPRPLLITTETVLRQ